MVKDALCYSIGLSTLLLLPLLLQQIFSADGGLIAIGGGKLDETTIVGGRRHPGLHPVIFHCLAILGFTQIALCIMAIAATKLGDSKVKKTTAIVYLLWTASLGAVQFSHPWTGSPPENLLDMPFPIVYITFAIVSIGWKLDSFAAKVKQ